MSIATARQYGNLVNLFDIEGRQCGSICIGSGTFLGHCGSYLVVQYQNMIVTFDKDQNRLGSTVMDERYRITAITEGSFNAIVDNVVKVYDKHCNYIDHFTV